MAQIHGEKGEECSSTRGGHLLRQSTQPIPSARPRALLVRVLDHTLEYGFESLGLVPDIVLTPALQVWFAFFPDPLLPRLVLRGFSIR